MLTGWTALLGGWLIMKAGADWGLAGGGELEGRAGVTRGETLLPRPLLSQDSLAGGIWGLAGSAVRAAAAMVSSRLGAED